MKPKPASIPRKNAAADAGTAPPIDGRQDRFAWIVTTLNLVLFVAVAALLVTLTLLQKSNPDIWFHLKTGEVISTTHSVPTRDIFSFTAAGRRWITHEWLSDVLLYEVYRAFSISGLAVTKALLVLIAAALIVLNAMARGGRALFGPPLLTLLLGLMALSSWEAFVIRPHLISWICLAAFVHILYRFKAGRLRSLLPLLPLQFVWANLHGFAVFGPVLAGMMWVGEWLNARLTQSSPGVSAPGKLRHLLLITLGLAVLTFLTPNGYHMVLQPLTLMATTAFQSINEWKPPFAAYFRGFAFVPYFAAWLVVLLVSYLLSWRKPDFTDILTGGFFAALSLRSERNIPLVFIVGIPIVYRNFLEGLRGPAGRSSNPLRKGAPRIAFACISGAIVVLVTALTVRTWSHGLAWNPKEQPKQVSLDIDQRVPRGAADYVIANKVPGNIWNWYELGGYLIWRFYPERKVFFDGRADVYADGLFDAFINFTPAEFADQFRKYGISAAIINVFHVPWVHDLLQAQGAYAGADRHVLVFFDDDAMVYLKDSPENSELVRRDGYRFIHPASGWREPAVGGADRLFEECRRAVAASDHNSRARRICEDVARHYPGSLGLGAANR